MRHDVIWKMFETLFEGEVPNSAIWFPNGKNSIRIRMKNNQEFIFTFENEKCWNYETVGHFLKRTSKGEKRN